ncbi:hypothetical protein IWW55_005247, partial [Coemansia sp. RSA 2706]
RGACSAVASRHGGPPADNNRVPPRALLADGAPPRMPAHFPLLRVCWPGTPRRHLARRGHPIWRLPARRRHAGAGSQL